MGIRARSTQSAAAMGVAAALGLGCLSSAPAAVAAPGSGGGSAAFGQSAALPAAEVTRLRELAQGYLQQRAGLVTATGRQMRAPAAPRQATAATAGKLQREFTALTEKGRRYKEIDGGYTRAQVEVELQGVTLNGATATARITEDTRLYHPFSAAEVAEGAPEYEEYSLPHTLTYTRSADGSWRTWYAHRT